MQNIAFAMWSLQGMLMEKCFTPDQEPDHSYISVMPVPTTKVTEELL